MTNQNSHWQKSRHYSAEQLEIGEIVLSEIRSGTETMEAVRAHPLSAGGYIAKHTLVQIYRNIPGIYQVGLQLMAIP